ncbi:MAG TPA: biotin--[acetyl-CoA-carboxylase] ligase [Pilimelia sp.]|nr:biotin--[acetyl-CoA-carboxylase] ligase [Pilimelia sp.]
MPDSPYTDLDRPPLLARPLRRALLVEGGLWTELDLRAETDSTNADALAAARAGAAEGLVVVAERQRAGRGRMGRAWVSPARAGLAVSVLLRPAAPVPARDWPAVPAARWGWLPLLAGVALVEAVRARCGVDAVLKWPNDLLVRLDGRARDDGVGTGPAGDDRAGDRVGDDAGRQRYGKCGGILAEAAPGSGPSAVVVGIGLNVSLRADELPDTGGGPPATSLRLAGARDADRDPLLRALLRALADWYARWRRAGGEAEASGLRPAYEHACGTIGRPVLVLLPEGERLSGTATGVDPDGRLVVRPEDDSAARAVAAGDVRHLR